MIANHFSRSKLVVHSHNTAPYKRSILSFIHYINRIYVNHIANVRIACSSAAGEYMFGRRYIGKFHILKNGIFLPKFVYNLVTRKKYRRNFNFADDSLVIGCVGQLSNRKNQFFLLKIMKKIVSFKPNSHLLLVGEGPAESMLREQVKSLAIENNVSFLGERNDVSSLYQMMDIAVFPSISEGLPISVIEAQASGLRTIISDQITKEVQLTPKVERLSLKDSVDTWAAEILKDDNQKPGREKDVQYIEQNGYSAVLSSEELSNIYTDLLLG
jgi:glycosyltransferase involved in cell wall biosynthesis